MDIKEFAKMVDGKTDCRGLTTREENLAASWGYVAVYGYSDDNAVFAGAISDEVGCYNGEDIYLDENGLFEECEDECKYSKTAKAKCKLIRAIWDDSNGEYAWTYETDIPHETFEIFDEEGNKWCLGIVFDIKNLRAKE
jgi:hypothetical protein